MYMAKEPLIKIEGAIRDYGEADAVTHVLRGIDLSIDSGEFVAIMGPSGSGKSTLLHVMGFLDRLSGGKYIFDGKQVTDFSNDELALLRRDQVGFVFQSFYLLQNSRVIDNVLLPLVYAGLPPGEREKRAKEALDRVGLSHRLDHLSTQLSGGERQRVAIARAIVNEPAVIFADEPTGNLDTASGEVVLRFLKELNEEGNTIVMVTHEMEAAHFARRIVTLRDGLLVSDEKNGKNYKATYAK